jgi:hypothetical protein
MNEIISINYCFPIHNIVLTGVRESNSSALALRSAFQERNYIFLKEIYCTDSEQCAQGQITKLFL